MISFLGAGGGGGGTLAGGLFAAVVVPDSEAGGVLGSEPIGPLPESSADLWFVAEFCRDLVGFGRFEGLAATGGSEFTGALAAGSGPAAGVFAATALGLSILLTCKLLITVLTPATLAACLPAVSRCASVSTVPDRVTTPLSAFTDSCFMPKPESWLKRS